MIIIAQPWFCSGFIINVQFLWSENLIEIYKCAKNTTKHKGMKTGFVLKYEKMD